MGSYVQLHDTHRVYTYIDMIWCYMWILIIVFDPLSWNIMKTHMPIYFEVTMPTQLLCFFHTIGFVLGNLYRQHFEKHSCCELETLAKGHLLKRFSGCSTLSLGHPFAKVLWVSYPVSRASLYCASLFGISSFGMAKGPLFQRFSGFSTLSLGYTCTVHHFWEGASLTG